MCNAIQIEAEISAAFSRRVCYVINRIIAEGIHDIITVGHISCFMTWKLGRDYASIPAVSIIHSSENCFSYQEQRAASETQRWRPAIHSNALTLRMT